MERGWVKVWRKLEDNPYMSRPNFAALWLHLLLLATHKEIEAVFGTERVKLKPGELITGRLSLSRRTGIRPSTLEDLLRTLEKQHQIRQRSSSKNRLISIVNWEQYQGDRQQIRQEPDSTPTALRHIQEGKNVKNEKKKESLPPKAENVPSKVVAELYRLKGWDKENAPARSFASHLRPAKELAEVAGGFEGAAKKLAQVKAWAEARDLDWSIETVFKKWEELEKPVLEKSKKAYIDGDRAYEKNGDWFIINSSGEHKKYIGSMDKLIFR